MHCIAGKLKFCRSGGLSLRRSQLGSTQRSVEAQICDSVISELFVVVTTLYMSVLLLVSPAIGKSLVCSCTKKMRPHERTGGRNSSRGRQRQGKAVMATVRSMAYHACRRKRHSFIKESNRSGSAETAVVFAQMAS